MSLIKISNNLSLTGIAQIALCKETEDCVGKDKKIGRLYINDDGN